MIINHNLASLNTLNALSKNEAATNSSLEKLSSGLAINTAADDAAGLAISEKMRGQIRGLDQASDNAQDGISLAQTAEGALSETTDILQRMRELAVQASNDTNTESDRSEIQKEINQLTSEINRIGNTTEFNTQKLLRGNSTSTGAVTTATTGVLNEVTAGSAATTASSAVAATGSVSLSGSTFTIDAGTASGAAGNVTLSFTTGGTAGAAWSGNTLTITLDNTDSSIAASDVNTLIQAATGTTPTGLTLTDLVVSGSGTIDGTSMTNASTTLSGGTDAVTAAAATAGVYSFSVTTNFASGDSISVGGQTYSFGTASEDDGDVTIGSDANATATALAAAITADTDNIYTATADSAGVITLTQKTAAAATTASLAIDTSSEYKVDLQIGANTGQSFTMAVSDMRGTALGVSSTISSGTNTVSVDGTTYTAVYTAATTVSNGTDDDNVEYALDVSSEENATAAIEVIDEAITQVSSERSRLGAYQNRLEHTINNLTTTSENMTSAESNIRDVDMAAEMAEYQKNSVLQQAAQSMLAQANQQPQQVLSLLK